jgi:hypothetical protein
MFTFVNWPSKSCAVEEATAITKRAGHNTLSGLLNLADIARNTITWTVEMRYAALLKL